MKSIISEKIERKFRRRQARQRWLFKVFKLRKMRKRIRKLFYKEQLKHDNPIYKLTVYAHAFKYDKKQIEYGLNLFVERGEILSYEKIKKGDSKDAYTLVFSSENRSHERILAEVPEEINLNDIKTEPIAENSTKNQSTASNTEEPTAEQQNNKPF